MGWFHALAAEQDGIPKTVYHLCPKEDFNKEKDVYYPKAYDDDKFTRTTHAVSQLTEIANVSREPCVMSSIVFFSTSLGKTSHCILFHVKVLL